MPRRPHAGAASALLAIALLGVTGCAPEAAAPAPTPVASNTPSAAPAPTEDPEPTLADVLIDGDSISVRLSDGSPIVDVPYATAATEAIQSISTALGETAEDTVVTDDPCTPILDQASFGGLHIWSSTEMIRKPQEAQFYVTADAATTAAGIPIVITTGQSVGDSARDVMGANSGVPSFDNGSWIDLHYDVISGSAASEPGEYFGAYAQVRDGELRSISAPTFYFFEC
ncbi:MAG: hypothetical protein ABW040_02970 [Microbacteriaceae bacterium]